MSDDSHTVDDSMKPKVPLFIAGDEKFDDDAPKDSKSITKAPVCNHPELHGVSIPPAKMVGCVHNATCPACGFGWGLHPHNSYKCPDKFTEVNDLVATDQEATTPPVESVQLPKDNQIAHIIKQAFSVASSNENLRNHKAITMEEWFANQDNNLVAVSVALATTIGEAMPERKPRFTNFTLTPDDINAAHKQGVNDGYYQGIDQFVEALRELGLDV